MQSVKEGKGKLEASFLAPLPCFWCFFVGVSI